MSKPTKSRELSSVNECQMNHAFEEAGRRVTAPNRLDEILKRAADRDPEGRDPEGRDPAEQDQGHVELHPAGRAVGRLWAAALLFLGLGVTIASGVFKNESDVDEAPAASVNGEQRNAMQVAGENPVGMQVADQDPKPRPKPKQDPKPVGGKDKPGKPLPKGTDPADLALLRSAEKMLEAEKNLKEMVKLGRIAGVDQVLPFDQLSGWKYTDALKGMPKKVKALHGKKVLMLGFMLPIDEVQNIKEFLLVESLWSCCYGTPPDINGIVRCVMPKDKRIDYQFDPLKVVGTIKVEPTMMDGYCVDIYQLHVEYIEVLDGVKKEPATDKTGKKKVGKDEPAKKETGKKETGKKETGK